MAHMHNVYQDLYLTDLKNDLDDVESELQKHKEKTLLKTDQIKKLQGQFANAKRMVECYRKIITDMQRDERLKQKLTNIKSTT